MVTTDTLHLIWDLDRERPTLGGALVLRQEGELVAMIQGLQAVTVHVIGRAWTSPGASHLAQAVFSTSEIPFTLIPADRTSLEEKQTVWPSAEERATPDFSYFSFSRLLTLYNNHRITPNLRWSSALLDRAELIRERFAGCLICLHLRYVTPYSPEENNAVGEQWNQFLHSHAEEGKLEFLLLGDDALPPGLALPRGATRAADIGLDLATQLALVSQADGFLGLASGLCTAANLSRTPHVLFKHPSHHPVQMQQELGDGNRFPFANVRQQLWRKAVTPELLKEALNLVLP